MQNKSKYNSPVYIYTLSSTKDYVPFYVGQTRNLVSRFRQHLTDTTAVDKYSFIKNILSNKHDLLINLIETTNHHKSLAIEEFWINQLSQQYNLLNKRIKTNGGEDGNIINLKLRKLQKSQRYLSKIFGRKPSQISQAINSDLYPTLRNKIISHIEKLESNRLKLDTKQ